MKGVLKLMSVNELIAELEKCNPNAKVVIDACDAEGESYIKEIEGIESIQQRQVATQITLI